MGTLHWGSRLGSATTTEAGVAGWLLYLADGMNRRVVGKGRSNWQGVI